MCLTAVSPADPADLADECSKAAYFADKRQLAQMYLLKQMPQIIAEKDSYHIVECCSCLYNKSVREHACCSLLILCHFLILSLLFRSLLAPYVFNGRSHADLADYAEECNRAALFRRQKTVTT